VAKFTDQEIKRALDGMSDQERAETLTRAALKFPKAPLGAEPLGPSQHSAKPAAGARAGASGARGSQR